MLVTISSLFDFALEWIFISVVNIQGRNVLTIAQKSLTRAAVPVMIEEVDD